ncbi:MAG: colicin E3 [Acetobacteraceae bacterium]|nr:colicin E3 [Acetobacteraceae bacterium]
MPLDRTADRSQRGAEEGRKVGRRPDLRYIKPPDDLKAFPDARRVRPKTILGDGKLRRRWKDGRTGHLLEWDYMHGTVEVYDARGNHLGEFDPDTGSQRKLPDTARRIIP